tara:strand:+ start:2200 stop:2883 length:684 start_codon:yes stop_codon:yes gene_type:complete
MGFLDTLKSAANPTSIDAFKANIGKHGGLAVQNRFAVVMTPPQSSILNLDLQGSISSLLSGTFSASNLITDPRDVALLCESCSLPGRVISTVEHSDFHRPVKKPTGYSVEDVTFVFHLTNDYYMKKMFDKWTEAVINTETYKANYKADYVSDVIIQQLNPQNVPVHGVKLINAYPVGVAAIELSNAGSDTTQRLQVTMAYDDFQPEGAISSVLSGVKEILGGFRRLI